MKLKIIALLTFIFANSLFSYSQTKVNLGKGLLWEITGNGLKKKSYLLGTIHLIPAKDYFFPKYYTKAVKVTKSMVMEIDMTDILGQLEVMKMAIMKDKELKDLYDEKTYLEITNVCRDSFQLDIDQYKNALTVSRSCEFSMSFSLTSLNSRHITYSTNTSASMRTSMS